VALVGVVVGPRERRRLKLGVAVQNKLAARVVCERHFRFVGWLSHRDIMALRYEVGRLYRRAYGARAIDDCESAWFELYELIIESAARARLRVSVCVVCARQSAVITARRRLLRALHLSRP